MTHSRTAVACAALALLLPALSGCVDAPFHKAIAVPPPAIAPTPEPTPAPLYTADLLQGGPALPEMPPVPYPNAQPTPPPQSEVLDAAAARRLRAAVRRRRRNGEIELAEKDKEQSKEAAAAQPAPPATTETAKVTAAAPTGDTAQPTSIGQFTAGATQDADESKKQTTELIGVTERGVNGLHRSLSGEQVKTVAQIRNFLMQAQHAMHVGDVDGAYTLATKAKLLLDELTGQS